MNIKPRLIVLCGLPGSGKSTDTSMMRDSDWFVYSTDDYLETVSAGEGTDYDTVFDEYIKVANTYMNKHVQYAIRDRQNVLWDQTNLTLRKRAAILSRFPLYYHKECWYYPVTERDYAQWRARLASRSGKTLPEHVLQSMIAGMNVPTKSEGFDQFLIKRTFS